MNVSRRAFIKGGAATLGGLYMGGCLLESQAMAGPKDGNVLIKNGNVYGVGDSVDIAVKDGKIIEVGRNLKYNAPIIDATGCFVSPGFVDSHMHLDKAYTLGNGEDLGSAIRLSNEYFKKIPPEKLSGEIYSRSRRLADQALANGTIAIKTHIVTYGRKDLMLASLESAVQLRKDYKDKIDILNVVQWSANALPELTAAVKNGDTHFIATHVRPELKGRYEKDLADLFRVASEMNMPIDLHLDESDIPDADGLGLVLDLTRQHNLHGRVVGGHITSLSAQGMDEAKAADLIKKSADVGLHVITLPSCNLFLMGRNDKNPMRRGITRVREFLQAGVNVAYASDNVRDHFRPFGNADMLEEGLLTAQIIQYCTQEELRTIYRMGTYNAAANCMLKDYGIEKGCYADLVILDAPNAEEALLSCCNRRYVLKRGRIVAENGKVTA